MIKLAHMKQSKRAAGTIPTWTVGDRLRKARETAGLDQTELADAMGVSRRTVSTYEVGGEEITRKRIVLNAWALATGVSVEWLVGSDGPFDGARSRSGFGLPHVDSNHEPAGSWGKHVLTSALPLAA
jgi:transcriptional regulator with XRE-family HTH domain